MTTARLFLAAMASLATSTAAWIQTTTISSLVVKKRFSHAPIHVYMNNKSVPNLLSVDECLSLHHQDDANVVFVDGTWFHKGSRNGRSEFEQGPRIPGARHFDIGDIAMTRELYPLLNKLNLHNMLPNADLFALTMDAMNITNDNHVIVYANEGTLFTPRVWWMFRHFGHEAVSLMQGSLQEWIQAGGPIETNPVTALTAKTILAEAKSKRPLYQCNRQENVVDLDTMRNIVQEQNSIIVDSRGSSFAKGHMPGAIHILYSSLVEKDNTLKLKSREELLDIFQDAGVHVSSNKSIVASCGSGVSACHVLLALEECGRSENTFLYDGSWQEYKSYPDTPKVIPAKEES